MPTYQPGTFKGTILDQGFAEASTGTPFFFLNAKIEAQYDAGGNARPCPQFEREVRFYIGDANGVGVRILLDTLRSLGVEVEDLARLDLESPAPIRLVGRAIDLECTHEQYKGRTQERWQVARPRRQKVGYAAIKAKVNLAPASKPDDTPSIQAGTDNPF